MFGLQISEEKKGRRGVRTESAPYLFKRKRKKNKGNLMFFIHIFPL